MGPRVVHAAPRVLPPAVRQALRDSFAAEVSERLPRLEALAAGHGDVELARRDAHTLGSSAYVVDRPDIALLARAVEDDLENGPLAELLARAVEDRLTEGPLAELLALLRTVRATPSHEQTA